MSSLHNVTPGMVDREGETISIANCCRTDQAHVLSMHSVMVRVRDGPERASAVGGGRACGQSVIDAQAAEAGHDFVSTHPGYGPDWLDRYRESGNYCVAQSVPDPNYGTCSSYLPVLSADMADPASARAGFPVPVILDRAVNYGTIEHRTNAAGRKRRSAYPREQLRSR